MTRKPAWRMHVSGRLLGILLAQTLFPLVFVLRIVAAQETVEVSIRLTGTLEANFQGSRGSRSAVPYYDSALKLSLDLQAGDDIRAEPGGPYSPARGETVAFDGSRSRPSKGRRIQSYKRKLTPSGCPALGKATELTGAHVTFRALCEIKTELTVDDGAKNDTRSVEIPVTERPWKTVLTTELVPLRKNLSFHSLAVELGHSRCKRHPDADKNHYYEQHAGSTTDYEEGTFWLDRVADSGPFAGVWFVVKSDFTIPRVTIVNQKLYPGGSVFDLNTAKSDQQKAQIDRLRRSVEKHEMLHSTLLARGLSAMEDPAKSIERAMARERDALKERMNFILRDAYTKLNEATSEDKVKTEMRKIREFVPGGRIYYPASTNAAGGYRDFPSYSEVGDSF